MCGAQTHVGQALGVGGNAAHLDTGYLQARTAAFESAAGQSLRQVALCFAQAHDQFARAGLALADLVTTAITRLFEIGQQLRVDGGIGAQTQYGAAVLFAGVTLQGAEDLDQFMGALHMQ